MKEIITFLLNIIEQHECISKEDYDDYMNNSKDLFTRPFIITLRKDKERYEKSSTLLKSLGLHPIKFYAIEGTKIEHLDFLKEFNLRSGEKGCLMSHLCIAALASMHKDKYTLIFEDDIISSLSGTSLIDNLNKIRDIQTKPDLIYLGKCFETCNSMENINDNIYIASAPYCTHALALNGNFAIKFTKEFGTIHKEAIDNLYRYYAISKNVLVYAYHPALFYQDVFSTESNLRPNSEKLGAYTECIDSQVHPVCPNQPETKINSKFTNSNYNIFIIIAIILVVILLIIILFSFSYILRRKRHINKKIYFMQQ